LYTLVWTDFISNCIPSVLDHFRPTGMPTFLLSSLFLVCSFLSLLITALITGCFAFPILYSENVCLDFSYSDSPFIVWITANIISNFYWSPSIFQALAWYRLFLILKATWQDRYYYPFFIAEEAEMQGVLFRSCWRWHGTLVSDFKSKAGVVSAVKLHMCVCVCVCVREGMQEEKILQWL